MNEPTILVLCEPRGYWIGAGESERVRAAQESAPQGGEVPIDRDDVQVARTDWTPVATDAPGHAGSGLDYW